VANRYGLDGLGLETRQKQKNLFPKTALGPTQSLIQWVMKVFSSWEKQPRHEADHSNAEVNNKLIYTSTLTHLNSKHRDN